ncbi:hypothetical protein ID866_5911 [Astraeus odoratus]|nr:hypothetical protein ID866_5911 [Astraeus odoratus]
MPEMREGADLDESSGALSSLRLDDDYAGVDGKQPKRDKGKGRESEGPLFTPQDAVLSEVFGFKPPAKTDPVGPSATSLEANADSISWSRSDADLSTLPPSLPIYDPFTGAKIGDHPPLCATTGAPANTTPSASTDPQARPQNIMHSLPTADDSELWNHLSRILELQAEVATMHTELEGFGSSGRGGASTGATSDTRPPVAKLSNPKKRTRGETIPMGDDDEPQPPPGGSGSQAIVTDSSSEDEDEDDAEGYAKRKRDEEFAKLEEQFRERKVAITRIMDKVRDLYPCLAVPCLTTFLDPGTARGIIWYIKGVPRLANPGHGSDGD